MARSRPGTRASARRPQSQSEFEQRLAEAREAGYVLRLYVAGSNPHSLRAIENTRRLCNEFLPGKCELHVIDLYQQPTLARRDRIITVPALVKVSPPPEVQFVGDMSNAEKILRGMGVLPPGMRKR